MQKKQYFSIKNMINVVIEEAIFEIKWFTISEK